MLTRITIHHVEMTSPDQLIPARPAKLAYVLMQAKRPSPAFNRFLYTAVGGDWRWTMRLEWTWEKWMAWLDRPELETWVAYVDGTPAGYCEMELQPEETVEIASFGLLPQFIGQGLGGALLTDCVRRAWKLGGKRVWLHTCSLDAPQALAAYRARGFREFETEEVEGEAPESAVGPWVGAYGDVPS